MQSLNFKILELLAFGSCDVCFVCRIIYFKIIYPVILKISNLMCAIKSNVNGFKGIETKYNCEVLNVELKI